MKITVIHVIVATLAVVATVISAHGYYNGGYSNDMGGGLGYPGGPYNGGFMGNMAPMGGGYGDGYGPGGLGYGPGGLSRGYLSCTCRKNCYWNGEFEYGRCWWCKSHWCRKRCCRWIY